MNPIYRRILAAALLLLAAAAPLAGQYEGAPLRWYGYLKMDASWDEGLVDVGNFARWVVSPETATPHHGFNMTARQTRLGFRMVSTKGDKVFDGRFEADFYAGVAENKNGLQVRHAYVDIRFANGWSLLAGQTSDVISPLVPTTLNYTVAWWAGNVGYRRPQFRVTKTAPVGSSTLKFSVAAARTIGDDLLGSDPGGTGSASGVPTVEGALDVSIPVAENRSLLLGGWAHRGEEYLTDEDLTLESTSLGLYTSIPLGPATLSGEAWTGRNMDDYFGGIGQGVSYSLAEPRPIDGRGAWAALAFRRGATRFNLGFGFDDPDDEDLSAGARSRNDMGFANFIHDVGGGLSFGLEYSYWQTQYTTLSEGTSSRIGTSVIYTFG